MPNPTANLALPNILGSQAQKHVTHNEALRLLDGIVQLGVLNRTLTAPPGSPAEGDRHVVAGGATGLWAGWDGSVAFWTDGAWFRLVPRPGWLAHVAAENALLVWTGSAWTAPAALGAIPDTDFGLVDDGDPTKKVVFELSGIATGTTRTLTLPDVTGEIAVLAGSQSFTGAKTFAGTLTVSAAAASLGTATGDAAYGLGTGITASGNTKSVDIGTGGAAGSTTLVTLGPVTAGAAGQMVINTALVTFASQVTDVSMPAANLTALHLGLGGASADASNRLSVNAPATLLNHAGAGHEVTVNKAGAGADASLAFKTGSAPAPWPGCSAATTSPSRSARTAAASWTASWQTATPAGCACWPASPSTHSPATRARPPTAGSGTTAPRANCAPGSAASPATSPIRTCPGSRRTRAIMP